MPFFSVVVANVSLPTLIRAREFAKSICKKVILVAHIDTMKPNGAIWRIVEKLRARPDIRYSLNGDYLEVPAADESGFCVWIQEHSDSYTVGYEGWHEEFEDVEWALRCFAAGMTGNSKVEVSRRGGLDYKWQTFILEGGEWTTSSITGLLYFPFWRKRETRFVQNSFMEAASEIATDSDVEKP